ncbi:MAG: RNA polymerase sigma factor [Candidatus Eisenbacteria bacterium]|uniref:RNA polymerase sigma factor n=1 Tax=Eiseniibacteriota bacterium TaxID=2212470 RepID=A0A948RWQ6_UNCEI|nr:RNA polymerase sigma factor [Candidatus Eisenbacteria bacterium]MBU1949359.1 RNA polymerase sigma factor [Candidatus Eisenbacteria bacterium]MBU2690432.1 RNA polymerase sigma factor [Candidatus Eisenbacteria bacterium]
MPLDDHDLVFETLKGSHAAFAILMQRYERLVYRFVYTYARNPEDALDLTQDAFIRTYEKLGSYRGEGEFRSWLLRVTHSVSANWLRSRRRQRDRQVHRVAVTLRYFERLPSREIAAVLECSEGTAKNLLFRGVDKMRRSLASQREIVR